MVIPLLSGEVGGDDGADVPPDQPGQHTAHHPLSSPHLQDSAVPDWHHLNQRVSFIECSRSFYRTNSFFQETSGGGGWVYSAKAITAPGPEEQSWSAGAELVNSYGVFFKC